jgi:hypothetical protein
MINSYSYYSSDADKLNEFVLAFFNRIEFETSDFSNDFFEKDFYDNLVSRHTGILLIAFKDIYKITKVWTQGERTTLCNAIRNSNEIEEICLGNINPTKESEITDPIKPIIVTLFKKLYKDVLFGEFFVPHYGNRKTHYHNFLRFKTNGYEWCPSCGIRPMHKFTEEITDQYDHYLPKDIYPFSSVNFKNLIPICSDCNSLQVKSNNDVLNHTGKVFYPFEDRHKPIKINVSISINDVDLEKIEWSVNHICEVGKEDELIAWKAIYKIDNRHKNYCKGNFISWYKKFYEDFSDSDTIQDNPDAAIRTRNYLRIKKKSNLFEFQCLNSFLQKNTIKAIEVSRLSSRY